MSSYISGPFYRHTVGNRFVGYEERPPGGDGSSGGDDISLVWRRQGFEEGFDDFVNNFESNFRHAPYSFFKEVAVGQPVFDEGASTATSPATTADTHSTTTSPLQLPPDYYDDHTGNGIDIESLRYETIYGNRSASLEEQDDDNGSSGIGYFNSVFPKLDELTAPTDQLIRFLRDKRRQWQRQRRRRKRISQNHRFLHQQHQRPQLPPPKQQSRRPPPPRRPPPRRPHPSGPAASPSSHPPGVTLDILPRENPLERQQQEAASSNREREDHEVG